MKTEGKAIIAIIIMTIFTAFGQLFFKLASESFNWNLSLIFNFNLWIGFVFYGIGAIIMIWALKRGEVSVLFPIISLSFIWVSFIAIYYFNEVMSIINWLGVLVIIVGVALVGYGR